MKETIDFITVLEEYKQLFTDFFCDPKPRSVKIERRFVIVKELSEKLIKNIGIFTLEKNEFQKKGELTLPSIG